MFLDTYSWRRQLPLKLNPPINLNALKDTHTHTLTLQPVVACKAAWQRERGEEVETEHKVAASLPERQLRAQATLSASFLGLRRRSCLNALTTTIKAIKYSGRCLRQEDPRKRCRPRLGLTDSAQLRCRRDPDSCRSMRCICT